MECEEIIQRKKITRIKWILMRTIKNTEKPGSKTIDNKIIIQKRILWIDHIMDKMQTDIKNNTKQYQYIKRQNKNKSTVKMEIKEWSNYYKKLLTESESNMRD